MIKVLLSAVGGVLLFGLTLIGIAYYRSPPSALDLIDRLWPSPATRVAASIPYLPGNRHSLDIWDGPGGTAPKPVLIFWYGGGWVKGSKEDYGFAARAYAAKGYLVVMPDYRLVPEVRFPVFVQDGAAAVKWVEANIAKYGGDPKRIAFSGHSAGAYTAIMLATDPRYLRAAGVDPKVVFGAVGLSGPYDFYPFTGRAIAAMQGVADYRQTQPLALVTRDAPPLMLVTGTEDTTVRPKNARNLARRMGQLGAPVLLKEYAGLNHEDIVMALSRPFRGKGDVLDASAAFLDRYSGRKSGTDR
ncbi:Alpha/beta hydrolase fold domain-containing protein [Sphingomonas antarctica]|uniref:alpha/beta hydrolase n=1 Tax=Sphingomonas antarctica TaxID=2040274 RepID=UPI0039EB5057